MKEYEVIYEQKVTQRARYVIKCEDEEALNMALDEAEMDMKRNYGDRFDDFLDSLNKQQGIEVVDYEENFEEDWEAPEYYDHNTM